MRKILLLQEPNNPQVREILEIIHFELRQYDWFVSLRDPGHAHSPAGYLGILIGTPELLTPPESQSLGWIRKYAKILTQKPTLLFTMGSKDVEMGPSRILTPRRKIVADKLAALGCAPRLIEIFDDKTEDADIRRFALRFADYVNSHVTEKSQLRRNLEPAAASQEREFTASL